MIVTGHGAKVDISTDGERWFACNPAAFAAEMDIAADAQGTADISPVRLGEPIEIEVSFVDDQIASFWRFARQNRHRVARLLWPESTPRHVSPRRAARRAHRKRMKRRQRG